MAINLISSSEKEPEAVVVQNIQYNMSKTLSGLVCVCLFFTSGCFKDSKNTCNYDACSLMAPDTEVQQVQAYVAANSISAVKHCSGLYYQIVSGGSGTAPTSCSTITFSYAGYFTNGTVFDKSTTPVTYSLINLIQGWKKGLPLIKEGGKIKLIVPPSLAYGAAGYGSVPPNAVLVFDIELVDVL